MKLSLKFCRYLKTPSQVHWRITSVISAVMAVLSKETGIMAMAINISVATLNYLIQNLSGKSLDAKPSQHEFKKAVQNPITSKLRRKKRAAAWKRILCDLFMVR